MPPQMEALAQGLLGPLMAILSSPLILLLPFFLAAAYFFAVWDQRKADSDSKEDGQVGIKLAILTMILLGITVAAGGAGTLLHYLLSGAKTGTGAIKASIGSLLTGGIVIAVFAFVFLPRTNARDYPKATRLTCGFLAFFAGTAAVLALNSFINALIMGKGGGPWVVKSAHLASVVVNAGLGIGALVKLGGLSGWTAPVRPVAPQPSGGYGQPMQQQMGMPPQQQGYPPQQQGYPPQGGGYPPQGGGGYPPQGGGGYPPQGGGY